MGKIRGLRFLGEPWSSSSMGAASPTRSHVPDLVALF